MDPTSLARVGSEVVGAARRTSRHCEELRATITGVARDTTYVGIGLTIMGLQRAQVLRRQLLDR